MECVPPESLKVLNTALPPLRETVPKVKGPSLNVTEPDGIPAPVETTAVNITLLPNLAGLDEEVRVVRELTLFTVWVTTSLVQPS